MCSNEPQMVADPTLEFCQEHDNHGYHCRRAQSRQGIAQAQACDQAFMATDVTRSRHDDDKLEMRSSSLPVIARQNRTKEYWGNTVIVLSEEGVSLTCQRIQIHWTVEAAAPPEM